MAPRGLGDRRPGAPGHEPLSRGRAEAAGAGGAGGADRFFAFLTDEVSPYVERHYRTAPMRVLAGHSLGGAEA